MLRAAIITLTTLFLGNAIYIIFKGFDPSRDVGMVLGELCGVIALSIYYKTFKKEQK